MRKEFKELKAYISTFSGVGRPKLNFQELYRKFPEFTFTTAHDFGSYTDFGKAFEAKNMNMTVSNGKNECYIVYREYGDNNENLAYVS